MARTRIRGWSLMVFAGLALPMALPTVLPTALPASLAAAFPPPTSNPANLNNADALAPGIITARPGVLNLRAGDVELAAQPDLLAPDLAAPNQPDRAIDVAPFPAGRRLILALDGPMTPARRAQLEGLGIRLGDYLPTNAFLADLSAVTPAQLRALGYVARVIAYDPAWKTAPDLGTRRYSSPERTDLASRGMVRLHVTAFEPAELNALAARASTLPGATLIETAATTGELLLDVPTGAARAVARTLAQDDAVRFIDEAGEAFDRELTASWTVQSNQANVYTLWDKGLTGVGHVLGIIDSRIAADHCAFFDTANPIGPSHRKLLAYNTTLGYAQHGTHVAGIAAGDTGVQDTQRGIAFGAKIVYNNHPAATVQSFLDRFTLHASQGAFVHTNSWGTDSTRAYNASCVGLDTFLWNNDDQCIVFAVSNTAQVNNPENAKNVLAVGGSQRSPNQANWCIGGSGPTTDGRRRPEVMAPGCSIVSATGASGCSTTALSGTSMATPNIGGLALLVRQYFTSGFYPSGAAVPADAFSPAGPLIKAVVVNAGTDMTGVAGYPSLREGWGRALADDALFFAGDARGLVVRQARNNTAEALSTGEFALSRITVTGSADPLKITLAYHDAPGAVDTTFAPVNQLALRVVGPDGSTYWGNNLGAGISLVGGSADLVNNTQQVILPAPTPGVYRVFIDAPAVQVGAQGYGVAITGAVTDGPCPADFDLSGFVDSDDFIAFTIAFEAGDPSTDFDGSGFIDSDDFIFFADRFAAGC
ncbi:MAG: S8 family serine peptidase [Planctomycetota bacterium]|nr:S8 family serine peptidase [Planctomycetota bacterium]